MTMRNDVFELEPAMRLRPLAGLNTTAALGVLRVETMLLKDVAAIGAEWRDLASRAIESNALFQPGLLLGAARHLPSLLPPTALLVWMERGENRRLVGFLPLRGETGVIGPRTIAVYASPYHNLGVPLLDREVAVPVLTEMLSFLTTVDPAITALKFTDIPLDGAFAVVLSKTMRQTGRTIAVTETGRRAILKPLAPNETTLDARLPAKRRREMGRIERRLLALGAVRYHEARGNTAQQALETFLALEASGWKGEAGTALIQTPRTVSFIRTAYREFAGVDQGRVIWLTLDDKPIAAALVYDAPGRSWFAKIAYDESLRHVAPGVQLVMAFSRRQSRHREIALTDSCATPDHPLMDPLWIDTMAMGDVVVGIQPGRSVALVAASLRHRLQRQLRAKLKSAVHAGLALVGKRKPAIRPRRATTAG